MKLMFVRVFMFRNIVDSGPVSIKNDITCLVGMNQSGKSAFLHALHRLWPQEDNVSYEVLTHYPAWRQKRDRNSGTILEDVVAVEARFQLGEQETKLLGERFGPTTIRGNVLTLKRSYGGKLFYGLPDINIEEFIKYIIGLVEFPCGTKMETRKAAISVDALIAYATELRDKQDDDNCNQLGKDLFRELNSRLGDRSLEDAVWRCVEPYVPRFLYFSEYSQLPYSVDIRRVLTVSPSELDDGELTARSLLRLGGADTDYLTNPNYEQRKRELENVSNALSRDVRRYWTQNPGLRMEPDITQRTVQVKPPHKGQQTVINELKLRIRDDRHYLSLPFDEHSTGFRWFFSFLAAFSKYEHSDDPLVILLDEPGLGLHAKAQADLLCYIEERLAPRCQVIYSTHSPFMVPPGQLSRVRLVEDKTQQDDIDPLGSTVTEDVSKTNPDTLFPLQGALGYDLVQHLFINEHNLVVEGTSDYTYLRVISDHLQSIGYTALDERWSIVPVGGVDLVPTFVALLGNHLDVTILIDATKKGHQKLSRLADQGLLQQKRILTVGGLLGLIEADIEDVFTAEEYLVLYNEAFGMDWTPDDIAGNDPIVRRIARTEQIRRFDHGRPADVFLRRRDEYLPRLSDRTLDRFAKIFVAINETLVD